MSGKPELFTQKKIKPEIKQIFVTFCRFETYIKLEPEENRVNNL